MYPPLTASYAAAAKTRGLIFIPQLPANTNLGPSVAGAPGARTVNTATVRSVYELAPLAVQLEMKWDAAKAAIANAPGTAAVKLDAVVGPLIEASGLDHGVIGLLAKALGVPVAVLVVVLLFVAWGMLRQSGLVPPIKKVIQ